MTGRTSCDLRRKPEKKTCGQRSPRHQTENRNEETQVTKYAPQNEAGEKPYVVERSGWGRKTTRVVYAENATAAKHRAFGRMGTGEYITGCRRATPNDIESRSEHA